MYLFPNKAEVTQISLTGARLIVILGALMIAPRDAAEMNALVSDCGLVDKNYSTDTIRIALSTLKALGCNISRPCKANNHKYQLLSHPFVLDFTEDEVNALKTVYQNLSKQDSYKTAVVFDSLIRKLNSRICNSDTVNRLLQITSFNKLLPGLLEVLVAQERQHNILKITYKSPAKNNRMVPHTIVFGKLYLRSNKLYVDGIDTETGKQLTFLASRIKSLEVIKNDKENFESQNCKIVYKLKNSSRVKLPKGHKIHDVSNDDVATIEAEFSSEFFAIQHILSLGADAILMEPLHVREALINKLKEVKKIYEQG